MGIRINIPEPCTEDWKQMTATEQGRFCLLCEKEVFDFTNLPKEKIYHKLTNSDQLCGRFTKPQLSQVYQANNSTRFSFYTVLAAVGLVTLFPNIAQGQDQHTPSAIVERNQQKAKVTKEQPKDSLPKGRTIKGYITDENGDPIIGATIRIMDTNLGAITDLNGNFSLNIPQQYLNSMVEISYIGMESIEVAINEFSQNDQKEIQLDLSSYLGEVVLVGAIDIRPTLWDRVKRMFRVKPKPHQETIPVCEPELKPDPNEDGYEEGITSL